MASIINQLSRFTLPGPGTATTVTAGGASTVDLSALRGSYVSLVWLATVAGSRVHLHAGVTGHDAATTNDIPLVDGQSARLLVSGDAQAELSAIASAAGSGTLYVAATDL